MREPGTFVSNVHRHSTQQVAALNPADVRNVVCNNCSDSKKSMVL